MKVYVNGIDGIADAITSMYMSKRSWTREKEENIRYVTDIMTLSNGAYYKPSNTSSNLLDVNSINNEFVKWMDTVTKWGAKHTTMLRFIDISVTVEGLHRGAQDDLDSHSMRFNNRIIRSSTRLADYNEGEMSDYYRGKILPTDTALAILGVETPETIEVDGDIYVKGVNGYILKGMENNKDVKRGLYMLSIPSNFIFKVNFVDWAHVYKQRCKSSNANPELKEVVEAIQNEIEETMPWLNRELINRIEI